jgi:hypothetical protein
MDVGHSDTEDLLWIFHKGKMEIVRNGDGTSHERTWGLIESENNWRGRWEAKTGLCSIAAPPSGPEHKAPPPELVALLNKYFAVTRFYFFSSGGVPESFSPS